MLLALGRAGGFLLVVAIGAGLYLFAYDPAYDGDIDVDGRVQPLLLRVPAEVASAEELVTAVRTLPPRRQRLVRIVGSGLRGDGLEEEAVGVLEEYDAWDRILVGSSDPLVIRRLEAADERVVTVHLFSDAETPQLADQAWLLRHEWFRRGVRKLVEPDLLGVHHRVARDTREHLIDGGWPVLLWTPRDPGEIARGVALRPYGFISDRLGRVRAQLADQPEDTSEEE